MARATITSKGQVTIPAEVRRALGAGPGDQLTFSVQEDGAVMLKKAYELDDLFNCLGPPPKRPGTREIVTPFRVLKFD